MKPLRSRAWPDTEPYANRLRMADAITQALTSEGKEYYDQLSDDEILDYGQVLWEYHTDLRDEWSRREMMRKAEAR